MRMRIGRRGLFLLLLVPSVGSATPEVVTTFHVVPAESSVMIRVGSAGVFGLFGHEHEVAAPVLSGTVEVDRTELSRSRLVVEFQASALRVTGRGEPAADVPEVQRTMQGERVLDVERHPSIHFRSREIAAGREIAGRISIVVRGDLTLRGVTRPVEVSGTVVLAQDSLTMRGTARMRQTDFGLRPVTAAGGTIRVKDQLDLEIVISARASGS